MRNVFPKRREVAATFHAPDEVMAAEMQHPVRGCVMPVTPEYFGDTSQFAREAFVGNNSSCDDACQTIRSLGQRMLRTLHKMVISPP